MVLGHHAPLFNPHQTKGETVKPSKNSRRKQERAEFHAVMNAISNDPSSAETRRRLDELKERYFGQVDEDLCNLGTEADEHAFIHEIQRTLDRGGWVTTQDSEGRKMEMKSNLWEYIRSRGSRDVHSALAAEHLMERSIGLQSVKAHSAW